MSRQVIYFKNQDSLITMVVENLNWNKVILLCGARASFYLARGPARHGPFSKRAPMGRVVPGMITAGRAMPCRAGPFGHLCAWGSWTPNHSACGHRPHCQRHPSRMSSWPREKRPLRAASGARQRRALRGRSRFSQALSTPGERLTRHGRQHRTLPVLPLRPEPLRHVPCRRDAPVYHANILAATEVTNSCHHRFYSPLFTVMQPTHIPCESEKSGVTRLAE